MLLVVAELDVVAVGAFSEQDGLLGLRMDAEHVVGGVAFLEQSEEFLLRHLRRNQFFRERGTVLFAVNLAFDVRAVFADSDDAGPPLRERNGRDRAGIHGVEGFFDTLFQALIALIKAAQERSRFALARGDIVEDLLHTGGKAQIDELFELMF